MNVTKAHMLVTTTTEQAEDGPFLREWMAVSGVRGMRPHRFWRVYNTGYQQALNDIRAGRLVLRDGFFERGVTA